MDGMSEPVGEPRETFRQEIKVGLGNTPKRLSSKFLYDGRGAALFDAICSLPEYYPTRTEMAILERCRGQIADRLGSGCVLIEPGSGSSEKVRPLLRAVRPRAYVPLDICPQYLNRAVERLRRENPELTVLPICSDFTRLDGGKRLPDGRRVVFFPGSTIGNLEPDAAVDFLRRLTRLLAPSGALIIGVDLKKDPAVLHAAYNDAEGITAAFNLNLLDRMNRELDADFQTGKFRHYAFYNVRQGRVEMHLVSDCSQIVHLGEWAVRFEAGESIHTENSYKYTVEEFQVLGRQAGFRPQQVWTDPEGMFSVHYMEFEGGWYPV